MASADPKQAISELFGQLKLKDDIRNNDEVMKWVSYAESFPSDAASCFKSLTELNEELITKSVLLGNGLTPSRADFVVFAKLHPFLVGLSKLDRQKLPNLMRWVDWIQNQKGFSGSFKMIQVEKAPFDPPMSKAVDKTEKESNSKSTVLSTVKVTNSVADQNSNKTNPQKKAKEDTKASLEQKKLPDKEPVEVEKEVSVNLLNIQIGLIRKAWKHPTADSLLVEEIDVGEANVRQVVSGLAKFCSPDELTNRHVVLITNVKPGKLRDVVSQGLVLCASNEDHTIIEPLLPPEGAKIGECVSFSGYDGKPEDVLNPKKKQLEKITPHLFTDDKGMATFKGIPFMTSGGPCRSSIPNASIK